jgi:predicted Zn-dependent protease
MASLGATAPAQFSKPSQQDQVKLGKRAAQEIRQKERVLPSSDSRVQLVRRVARRLLSGVDDKGAPWEYSFDVIDNKEVNAFALPGGPTFVYTGLLDKVHSEDELAAVMGHELTHVRREHWAYQYRDEQTRNLGLSLLLILGKANRTITNLASIGAEVLINLPYSRGHESEADDGGFDMMTRAGYNPQGMVDLFTTLKGAGGSKPPEWLSTHPADSSRINHVKSLIDQHPGNWPALTPINLGYYDNWYKGRNQRQQGGGGVSG